MVEKPSSPSDELSNILTAPCPVSGHFGEHSNLNFCRPVALAYSNVGLSSYAIALQQA